MVVSAAAFGVLLIFVFSLPAWMWKVGFLSAILRELEQAGNKGIEVQYSGTPRGFKNSSRETGLIIAFYETKTLERRIRDGVSDLIKTIIVAVVAQVLLIAVWLMALEPDSKLPHGPVIPCQAPE